MSILKTSVFLPDVDRSVNQATTAGQTVSPIDGQRFRAALGRFATGVVVICADDGFECRGMTANAFMSGSLEPPLIIVSVGRRARMHRILEATDVFGVTVLARDQESHSRWFAGQVGPAREVAPVFARLLDVPVLPKGKASLAARVVHRYPCGDHTLFVGAVEALEADEEDSPPLVFYAGRYAHVDSSDLSGMREVIPAPPFFY